MDTKTQADNHSHSFFFLLLSAFLLIIYSNSFDAGWHLDDPRNILDNPHIHMNQLTWQNIKNTFHASIDGGLYLGEKIYRPVTCLTFGVNWFFGQKNIIGYHLINFTIHLFSAFFLYLTILMLFKTPALNQHDKKTSYWVASLSALFWAVHPIQVPAVTYIVQRMASLSALFYLMGLFAYLKARLSTNYIHRVVCFCLTASFYLLALGSKENAVLLPGALALMEFIFFKTCRDLIHNKKVVWTLLAFSLALVITFVMVLKGSSFLIKGYELRSFTIEQRLMTQPYVLLFHLSQFFLPAVSRFSIAHDITVPTDLFSPLYTLPSIAAIIIIVILALGSFKKYPLFSFTVLFFFLNHLVESTIIPLELIFEHRNYLPGLFVFSPFLLWIYPYTTNQKPILYYLISLFIILFMINSGFATYVRNMTWKTELSLWEDAMTKSPLLGRPMQNYSVALGKTDVPDKYEKIFKFNQKVLGLKTSIPMVTHYNAYRNMGNAKGFMKEYEGAVTYFKEALKLYPGQIDTLFDMSKTYTFMDRYKAALEIISSTKNKNPDFLVYKGLLLIKNSRLDAAALTTLEALRLGADPVNAFLTLGTAFKLQKKYTIANHFFLKANHHSNSDLTVLLSLIENCVYLGEKEKALDYAKRLILEVPFEVIETALTEVGQQKPMTLPISYEVVTNVLSDAMTQQVAVPKTL